jgi:hypothetical protein
MTRHDLQASSAPAKPRAYYFGCWQGPGHGLHHVGGRSVRPHDGVPFDPFDNAFWLDGGLAPRRLGAGEEYGAGRRAGDVFFALDGRDEDQRARLRRAGRELPQGEFLLHRFRGRTLMAWWDRTQGDERGACNSVFIVEGDRTTEEMLALWPQCFPLQAANLERAGAQLREATP